LEIAERFWGRVRQVAAQKRQVYFVVALFLIALLIRYLVFLFYFDAKIPFGADSDDYIGFGSSLALGDLSLPEYLVRGGYANTILYPLFLAAHYRVFGSSPISGHRDPGRLEFVHRGHEFSYGIRDYRKERGLLGCLNRSSLFLRNPVGILHFDRNAAPLPDHLYLLPLRQVLWHA